MNNINKYKQASKLNSKKEFIEWYNASILVSIGYLEHNARNEAYDILHKLISCINNKNSLFVENIVNVLSALCINIKSGADSTKIITCLKNIIIIV